MEQSCGDVLGKPQAASELPCELWFHIPYAVQSHTRAIAHDTDPSACPWSPVHGLTAVSHSMLQ